MKSDRVLRVREKVGAYDKQNLKLQQNPFCFFLKKWIHIHVRARCYLRLFEEKNLMKKNTILFLHFLMKLTQKRYSCCTPTMR